MMIAGGVTLAAMVGAGGPAHATTSGTTAIPGGSCITQRVAASYTPGGPASGTLSTTLCTPWGWARGTRTVDVLVHGAMYNGSYWNWPQQPEKYSYVRKEVAAGRAAFYYDGFGAGDSSRPNSAVATFDADVYALHQMVQRMHARFPTVDVIGHSLGSVVVTDEQGKYNDADKVVLTGLTHGHGPGFVSLPTAIYPAVMDPEFKALIPSTDQGYITTLPGKRAGLFYSSSADRSVIAYDEAHKDVMTLGQSTGAIAELSAPAGSNTADKIKAPVLMILGQEDAPFCGNDISCASPASVAKHEAPYFTGAKSFTTMLVPDTGHDLTLHPSAQLSFDMISNWLQH